MKKSPTLLFAGVLASAALVAAPAATAHADLTTRCVGEAGAVTVPGDLVVPAGESCSLDGTTVEGRVTVRKGANLVVTDGTFKDRVVVQADGYLDLTNTTVEGRVRSNGGYGTYASGSTVGGYTESGAGELVPFLYAEGVTVDGSVVANGGEVYLADSEARTVRASDVVYADVINSTLTGKLEVSNAEFGSNVCASEVDGDATFEGNAGVQLGSGSLFGDCDGGSNYFGGDVTINNSTQGVQVNANIVRGNLAGEGNDPAPTGADNRVRGELQGQFADLKPAVSSFARKAPVDHTAKVEAKMADRKAAAVKAADAAGKAAL